MRYILFRRPSNISFNSVLHFPMAMSSVASFHMHSQITLHICEVTGYENVRDLEPKVDESQTDEEPVMVVKAIAEWAPQVCLTCLSFSCVNRESPSLLL